MIIRFVSTYTRAESTIIYPDASYVDHIHSNLPHTYNYTSYFTYPFVIRMEFNWLGGYKLIVKNCLPAVLHYIIDVITFY